MRKFAGGFPPRYPELLRLTLAAALLRLVPLAPFFLAYFVPLGSWFKGILLACPLLLWFVVCPARARYGRMLAAYAADGGAPLSVKLLVHKDDTWRESCRGRLRLLRWQALPLAALLLFLLVLLWFFDVFAALKILLNVFAFIGSAVATAAAFLPRLLMGEGAVVQTGILGGVIALLAALLLSAALFGRAAFRTSLYRFGGEGKPKAGSMKPLFKTNMRIWLPTLCLSLLTLVLSYGELSLWFANVLSAAPVFCVKLQIHQYILLALTAVSYFYLLPLRRYHTARRAAAPENAGE